MKILMITPYVTIEGIKEFERNKTGFGYMVYDIAKSLGLFCKVDILTTWTRGKSFDSEGIHFLTRSFTLFFRCLIHCVNIKYTFKLMRKYTDSWGTRIRFIYCWLLTGYLDRLLEKGEYDIVHIHGCIITDELWFYVCRRRNVKFLVTLHGLNTFSNKIILGPFGKLYEESFLQKAVKGEIPITVISTGIKRKIEDKYGLNHGNNITVICNSFNTKDYIIKISPREKYNIPKGSKILLYIGNISENKNQRQMVEAFNLLPEYLSSNTWVLFCGRQSKDGSFEKFVGDLPNKDHFILCGIVEKSKIGSYYKEADGVVLLSYSEGFGLSLIEAMHYGVPCAMFSDMDAFEDIFDSRAVVSIKDRSNLCVAKGISKLLTNKWDSDQIVECSKKHENSNMAIKYLEAYKKTISQNYF